MNDFEFNEQWDSNPENCSSYHPDEPPEVCFTCPLFEAHYGIN